MNVDEKTKCFKEAFLLARKGRPLTKKHIEVFNKVYEFLGKKITSKIEKCNSPDKGILLVGNDGHLTIGAVAFVWVCHILKYQLGIQGTTYLPLSGTQCGWFWCQDYWGLDEEIIKKDLDSEIGTLEGGSNNIVLFFRNINIKHTDSLNRIARTIRHSGLRFSFIAGKRDQNSAGFQSRVKYAVTGGVNVPQLIILNVEHTVELSKEFLQNFEVIDLKTGSGEKEITKNKNAKVAKRKDNFADVKIKMIVDLNGNYSNAHYKVSVTCNNLLDDKFKLAFRFMPVLYLLVKGVKKDTLYVSNKELKKARRDLDDAKKEIIKAFTKVIGQRSKKIIKIETGVGKKLMIPNKNINLQTNEPAFKEKV